MLRRRPVARLAVGTAVVAGTASAVGGRAARRQQANAPQPAPAAEPEPAAPAPTGPSEDSIQKLSELAALKDQGVLTDAEFAAEKAKILG